MRDKIRKLFHWSLTNEFSRLPLFNCYESDTFLINYNTVYSFPPPQRIVFMSDTHLLWGFSMLDENIINY